MMFKTFIVAASVLATPMLHANEPLELPSTVCYPAVQALQEPTTEANLTPYDPFNHLETSLDEGAIPNAEPTTTAMAIIVLKEIGKAIGTKIYESIFRDGAKRTLTKADFDRIAQIVKEALREDAKRKINNCVISLQETSKLLATSWNQDIAVDTYTTSSAVIDVISHFDHTYSKVALMPSAMLIGSLQAGIAQEFLKRGIQKEDAFFHRTRDRLLEVSKRYADQMESELLDPEKQSVKWISYTMQRCGGKKHGHGFCWEVVSRFWGKLHKMAGHKCEKTWDECHEEMMDEWRQHEFDFFILHTVLYNEVYHRELIADATIEVGSVQIWEAILKRTPAREPKLD